MQGNADIAPLLKRAFMFLEDGEWNNANEYCEKVLDTILNVQRHISVN